MGMLSSGRAEIMETETTYLTRRARQERASAAEANSAEARAAHLKLAVRLVRAATAPGLWRAWSSEGGIPAAASKPDRNSDAKLDRALAIAFPVPSAGAFENLLDHID